MADTQIFDGGDNQNVGAQGTSETTDGTSLLNALVGETQKYKTAEDLAKAYANADGFIETLKEENRKLREQVAHAKTIDDVLERMSSKQSHHSDNDNSDDSGLTPETVQKLIANALQGKEQQDRRNTNLAAADRMMKEKFGAKAVEVFNARANTPEKKRVMMEMAATDPQEFFSMFNTAPQGTSNNVDPGSSVNTTTMPSNSNRESIEWTREYCNKVRKEQPALFWSQEFQWKMAQAVTKNPKLYHGA